MNKLFLILALALHFVPNTFASKASCRGLDELKIKLSAHSSNLLNARNTKSTDGKFYKKRVVQGCKNGRCQIIKVNRFLKEYEPGHPDADQKGYVKYPDIDVEQEHKMLAKQVRKLRKLAKRKVCQTKLLISKKDKRKFRVKYTDDVISDTFKMSGNKVASWTVDSPFGKNTLTFLSQ